MSDFPSPEEELERKVSETLVETLERFDRSEISAEAAKASLRALWGATAGLVSKELMGMIADGVDAIDERPDRPRASILVNGKHVAVIEWPEAEDTQARVILIRDISKMTKKRLDDADMTLREVSAKANEAFNTLKQSGFKVIT